jgi:hypothetical protein
MTGASKRNQALSLVKGRVGEGSSARRQHFDTLSDQAEGKKAFTVSV